MSRAQRHTPNTLVGLTPKNMTRRARHHPRAHPVRTLPPIKSTSGHSRKGGLQEEAHDTIHIDSPKGLRGLAAGADFYLYVNKPWLQRTSIPPYVSTYGVSEEIEEIIQSELLREMYSCMRLAQIGREQTTVEGKLRDGIGRLAMSAMRPQMQENNIEYLKRGITSMGCLRDLKDIATSMGTMRRYNIPTLLEVTTIPGEDGYVISLAPGELGLPAASYYSSTLVPGAGSSILIAYTELIKKTCSKLEITDFSTAVPFEANIAAAIYTPREHATSTTIGFESLHRRWPAIDWGAMFQAYGVPANELKGLKVYIDSEEWLNVVNGLVKEIPLETWYTVFALHIMLHAIPYLPAPYDTWQFDLFGKLLRGQKEKLPQRILTLNCIKQQMSAAMGYLFVKEHFTPAFKGLATKFVEKIVGAAIARMKTVDWMGAAARKAAAEKLRRMKLSIAWSAPLLQSPPELPSLQTDTFLANIYLLEATLTDRKISYLKSPPKMDEWEEPPYYVNAYYYHDTNELVIPAGSFLWPFYDMGGTVKGVGWNFGGLGAVIAHEITHAFDREGKEFDPVGHNKKWWSKEVLGAYEAKTKQLVRLFEESKVLGQSVNGTLTLNENLADLGGLAIVLDALKEDIKNAPEEEKKKELRDFFISYAVSWRTREHPQRKLQRLLLDNHAPPELRVNLIVSQFEEWYAAFDVQTSDHLYIPPEERIRIF
jgi:putative endopeptidase